MSDLRQITDNGTILDVSHKGDRIETKTTFDVTPVMEHATALRNAGEVGKGHWRHVASIDARLITHLAKEAGIKVSDTKAVKDMLKRKLQDGTLSNFRVWEGTF